MESTAARTLVCLNCGGTFVAPAEIDGKASATLVDSESARCVRLQEIRSQRKTLVTNLQAGIAGMVGTNPFDTIDMVAQRRSVGHLDATLKAEERDLERIMLHVPVAPAAPENVTDTDLSR
jgi:hypothetical protein